MNRKCEASNGPSGIGGWLLVIVVMLIFTPIQATIRIILNNLAVEVEYPNSGPMWQDVKNVVWIGLVFSGSLYLLSAFFLVFKRKRSTVKFVFCAIWLAGPVNLFFGIYVISSITTGFIDVSTVIKPVFVEMIMASVLTLYFFRSRRVRNTYSETEAPR